MSNAAVSDQEERSFDSTNALVVPQSSFDGFTVGVKDNIVTDSQPSSCASDILRGHVGQGKATVVQLMEDAGMLVIGKTNMDEFGMGSHNLNSAFGPLEQPHTQRSAGGSSGGSAVALAQGQCDIALGTDTGGSVRLPAAYLGLYGFKPSYGLISRYGVVPYANSLDTVGILAKTPNDAWLLFQLLSQPDSRDPTCLSAQSRARIDEIRQLRTSSIREDPVRVVRSHERFTKTLRMFELYQPTDNRPMLPTRHIEGIRRDSSRARRIGVPTDYNIEELQPEVREAWTKNLAALRQMGHEIVPISLPTTKHALSAYYVLAPAEASSNLAKYDGIRYGPVRGTSSAEQDHGTLYSAHRGALFGDEVQRRILLGAFSLSAGAIDNYFLQAQRVRRLVQQDFNQVFRMGHPLLDDAEGVANGVDYIVCPTAPTMPPKVSQVEKAGPIASYMNDVFTVPASLAGLPALSVPAPPAPGERLGDVSRSIGLQIIGQYGDDVGVLKFANSELHLRADWGNSTVSRWTVEGHRVE